MATEKTIADRLAAYGVTSESSGGKEWRWLMFNDQQFGRATALEASTLCNLLDSVKREALGKRLIGEVTSEDNLERALLHLTEKVERANAIQHFGGKLLPEDWSELFAMTNEARVVLSKLNTVPQPSGNA